MINLMILWGFMPVTVDKLTGYICFSLAPLPQFPSKVSLDRDCYVAHKMAAISCLMERYVVSCLAQQEIMQQSETHLR